MQDRKGLDPGYPVPGTWYLTPMPHSPISNLNGPIGHTGRDPTWARVPGTDFRVSSKRNPSHFYPASCILYPASLS
jgi:hypothetical protein